MRSLPIVAAIALWALPARAHEDLMGMPKELRPAQETLYMVWISKPGKVHVRWTNSDEKPKRFHGKIECEGLWTEADRLQTGQPGTAVKIAGGGGELRWDAETGKWIDGFDAVHNPTKLMRFSFWLDGKRVDPKMIKLGSSLKNPKWPVFYWLDKPVPEKWPQVDGFPAVTPGQKTAYYIGTNEDGYMFVKASTKGEEAEVKFTGNIIAEGGRMDLVSGLEKDPDERIKQSGENKVQWELSLKGTVDGFKFRPGGGTRKLELELYIDGKDATTDQVFLGKDAKNPAKAAPVVLMR
jgi:hypothetical protein